MLPKHMKNINVPNMYLHDKVLSWVAEQKYLGIIIDKRFSCVHDKKNRKYKDYICK